MTARGFLLKMGMACAAIVCGAGHADSNEVTLSLEDAGSGAYRLEGIFSVKASSAAVWNVLTDYDRVADFVSSMRRSRVRERQADHLLLEQEASGRVLLFSRRVKVLLRVREKPFREILFEDVSRQDFESYAGFWRIEEAGEGVLVIYFLQAKRKFPAPDFVARGIFRKNAEGLLREVRAEILRRAHTAVPEQAHETTHTN